ncbi:MAG TPA: MBL fold metallo-hydrolase [Gemmataceae bacterium]|jgi:L-ascorbate metabolism protein UlaG (beta-lactamase superfamily)|nr:MBL fold metallo-hydrolase [Gemmataceae bacterium]
MRHSLVAGLTLALFAIPATAQAPKKALELRFYGHSFFQLTTTAGTKIVFDPHGINEYGVPPLSPDIVVMTHNHDDHNRKEQLANADSKDLKAFLGVVPKGAKGSEWAKIDAAVKDVRIRNVPTYHDDEEGAKRGKNTIFVVEADGLKFCHLGDLGHELNEEQVRAVGPIDVLMIPVGGIYTINGEVAKKVVAQLKPRLFIIPMHYGTKVYNDLPGPDEFLDGQKNVRDLKEGNLLEILPDLKADKPTIVMMGYSQPKG